MSGNLHRKEAGPLHQQKHHPDRTFCQNMRKSIPFSTGEFAAQVAKCVMNNFLRYITPEELVSAEHERVTDILTASGTSRDQWNNFYMPLLHEYALYTQRLPLARSFFYDPMGAFQFGLITACVAIRYASQHVFFPDAGAEDNFVLRPQTTFGVFAAALATGVAVLAENTRVLRGEDEYHPLLSPYPLSQWLEFHPLAEFQWRVDNPLTATYNAAIAARFIVPGLLADFDPLVTEMIFSAINPALSPGVIETTMAKIVRQCSTSVIEQYEKEQAKVYRPGAAVPAPDSVQSSRVASHMVDSGALAKHLPLNTAAPTSGETANLGPRIEKSLDDLLDNAPPALQEWFNALPAHENFKKFQAGLIFSDEGIEIKIAELGGFGLKANVVRNFLTNIGVVRGRSASGTGIVLDPVLTPIFKGEYKGGGNA